MTDKPGEPSTARRGAPMNRMMPDTYEKRGMTTAHLRQAVAGREGQGSSPKAPADTPVSTQTPKPKADD